MKLSSRLKTILEMFEGQVAADVGSDHGKLIISLYQEGKITKGYAIENKKGPYSRLYSEIEKNNLLDKVIPMLSDGISELPKDVDSIVIAGMGGGLIIDIIQSHVENLKNVNYIYIDAHNSIPMVRRFICSLGFNIFKEEIVEENDIYYEIIGFKKDKVQSLDDLDYEFGPFLRKEKSNVFIRKHRNRIKEIEQILKLDNIPDKKHIELTKEKELLERIIGWKLDNYF